jgi:hypothetical protein
MTARPFERRSGWRGASRLALIALFLSCLALTILSRAAGAAPDVETSVAELERQWARISYDSPDIHQGSVDQQMAFASLSQQAETLAQQFPDEPLPMAWRAIIMCSHAEAVGGFQAFGEVTQARDLLLQARKIDPHVMNGTVDGYLGTLYYKVPGWPIGFGDKRKAVAYFQQGIVESPAGIDSNLLYAKYLIDQGDNVEARNHLQVALKAPIRPDHADYDRGRRQDIDAALAKIK